VRQESMNKVKKLKQITNDLETREVNLKVKKDTVIQLKKEMDSLRMKGQ
jgi:hypothetical protein